MTKLLPKEWQIKKQVRTEQNIPLVFHSVGSRRENLGSVLKTVLIRGQPVTWPILKLSLIDFSFSPSSTCCFAALAPIPALHTAQWGPEVLSAARSSQADDFGEQGKGRVFSMFFPVCWYSACGSVIGTYPLRTRNLRYGCGFVCHYIHAL